MARTKGKKQVGTGFITDVDRYLYGNGTHYEIYEKLGAHPKTYKGKAGYYFAVWAPHAKEVSLVGNFNNWNTDSHPMQALETSGIYEIFVPGLGKDEMYKFAITTPSGKILFKADPYAFHAEYRPGTASITSDISGFPWKDEKWMEARKSVVLKKEPMSIYEVHLGSWRKKDRAEKDGYYTYKEAASELADYVVSMGYTHVELIGIAEHPFDGSWGYQVTGYFAPTSRYGTPDEFMYFVNYLHKKGIGVILDWVPAHFPRDAHGLADFDGQALYEYADPRKGEHPDWGTKVFDYEKNEVKNFLIGNALYWIDKYHIDGLRVDAVASMLYLDYGRSDGCWIPNKYGGNENLEAIEFFKHLNSIVQKRGRGAIVIAEESTAWPKVTHDPEDAGLGFTFKWNMGWMHDFLEYMKLDPYFRKYSHHKMTFGMTYATSEHFILVLSHDEVVHLKCSMINKMPGIYEDKFANLKVGYTFMMAHPGKKLLFMGQDFGQWHEWDEKVSLDWHLVNEDLHKDLQNYVRDLLKLYRQYPALYRLDDDWDGFQWINANDGDRSIFSFIRRDETGKRNILVVCNFTPVDRPDYRIGVPKRGNYTLLLDNLHGLYRRGEGAPAYRSKKEEYDNQPFSFDYPLPAYGTAIFRF
ncbi:1,4-alpha-glucan branching protein GlgB [Lachnospiraceae bacterium 62-35]